MLADILLAIVSLCVLSIATYTDLRTKEIPDLLTGGFLFIAAAVRFLYALLFSDWMYFLNGLAGFLVMLIFGMALYYGRQWGGGDAKLVLGLGVAFATTPPFFPFANPSPYFLFDLIVNIFAVGALYGILQAGIMFFTNFKKTAFELKKSCKQTWKVQLMNLLLAATIYFGRTMLPGFMQIYAIILALFLFIYMYLYLFVKAVEKSAMFKRKKLKDITEGDWIAQNIYAHKKLILPATPLGVTKRQLLLLRQHHIKEAIIKEGIAFVPAIFLGTIVTLTAGNIFLFLMV